MTIINTSPNKLIQIGYEGEDKVTILRFGYSEKWLENGEGIFTVRVLRNGENQAYNAQLIEDDRENYTIDMTLTDVELSIQGYGEMQLVYTGANFVKKSPVYKYYVSRSIDEAVDPPDGDVYTQIIESLADLRVDFNELSDIVSEINDDIGDLAELTTANKLNIVESINEVNAKSFVSVDDELSDASTNPVQNKVITSRIISAESAIQGKANVQIVSALSDDVSDLQTDVQGLADAVENIGDISLLTTTAKTDLVSAINEVNEHGGGSVTVDDALSTTSTNPVQNKVITARINGLDSDVGTLRTSVQNKADTQTVSALADAVNGLDSDVQGLQTAVQSKVGDVQVNGTSIVSNGVAVFRTADSQTFGLIKLDTSGQYGLTRNDNGLIYIYQATSANIKGGSAIRKPIVPQTQHESAFYGLAKAAGHDEKNSTLPVGTYSDEAKTAIRTMLGLQEMYEWYKNQT